MEFIRKRVLIWSGNRSSGTSANFVVSFRIPIDKVVSAEWVSASLPGYAVAVQELGNNSYTTNGMAYWRFTDGLQNGRFTEWKEQRFPSKTIRQLSVQFINPDGTVPTLPSDHVMEIEFLCEK